MDYLQKKSIRSVAAAITGFLRHSVRKIGITREKLPSCIALVVCPLVTFYLFEMYTHNPFHDDAFQNPAVEHGVLCTDRTSVIRDCEICPGGADVADGLFHGGRTGELLCAEFPFRTHHALGYLFHQYSSQCGREF